MDSRTTQSKRQSRVDSRESVLFWLAGFSVLAATLWLWRPVLNLFWYRDDYPLLYWLMHPEGPINPADVGDFKLPIYHGLLELHWPIYQLFGLDVTMHRAVQLVLLLLAVSLVYWLALRIARSHVVATASSLLLATTPVALSVTERVSLAYQGYLVIILVVGTLLLLLQWQSTKQRSWVVGAGILFLLSLYLVGVRLHATFIGIGAIALWLGWSQRAMRRDSWIFVAVIAMATVGMVLLGGLGRNALVIAPTVFFDILGTIGNLILPSTGIDTLFAPIESEPIAIVARYRWLVGLVMVVGAGTIATLSHWKLRSVQGLLGLSVLGGVGFMMAAPDVSQGDRTLEAELWLSWLAGGQALLLMVSLVANWSKGWQQQLMLIGLGWAVLAFLPSFLVQPGDPFGTTDKYFVSSLPGLLLFWIGALSLWINRRQWGAGLLVMGMIGWGTWLIQADLTMQHNTRAVPARTIHRQLEQYANIWPTEARIVLLADQSPGAAYQLHEAFAASTIRDEAIFTVLYGIPYDTRALRIVTLDQAAAELAADTINLDQIFVYRFSTQDGLVDDTAATRAELGSTD